MKQLCLVALSLALLVTLAGCRSAVPDVKQVTAVRDATSTVAPAPSKPPAPLPVPSMKGKAVRTATQRLESAGFATRIQWKRSPATWGMVIAQTPAGGTAAKGATVLLTVSIGNGRSSVGRADATPGKVTASDDAAARAFRQHESGISLSGEGAVTKVLADDNSGGRHQRFILRLASGQTLLIAHNIDIAPRLPTLGPGDAVAFKGIYEWSSQGGIVHWTHHDPGGQHPAGWLKRNGSTYQ